MADPDVKFFFLVAGYDYEAGGSLKGLDFGSMCTGRVSERIDFINKTRGQTDALVSADTALRFIRFSVETGKIEVIERAFDAAAGIKKVVVKEADWKPLSSIGTGGKFDPATFVSKGPFRAIDWAADYDHSSAGNPTLKRGAATRDILSILNVYHSVHDAPDGSLLELSIFSHGWINGPVLVNSSDLIQDPKLRDPDDKDGRAALDFKNSMGEDDSDGTISALNRQGRFMMSFDLKGVLRTWGCSFDIEISVFQQAQKRIKRGGIADDTVIDFEFEAKWFRRYRVADPDSLFLPKDSEPKISRTFLELKRFFRRRLAQSYVFQFTRLSPMLVAFGALPGTEGNDEKTGFKLMKVCRMKDKPVYECPDGFAEILDFYEKTLGVKADGRGYGIFDVHTVQKLAADIAADAP